VPGQEVPAAAESVGILAERTVATGTALQEPRDGVDSFASLFQEADFVIEDTWVSAVRPASYGETNGALCLMHSGLLSLYTPTQWLSHLRKAVSGVTGYDPDSILVCRTNSSNLSTNTVWRNAVLAAQICVGVCRTGKPVKLMMSREEQELYMENNAPVTITHRTAVTKSGEITAMHVTIDVDAGAWNPFAPEILDRLVIAACGIYCPQNLKIDAVARSTRTPPSSVNLSTIDAQAFFAVENQIQKIADTTGISPLDIRLKNIRTGPGVPMPFQFYPGDTAATFAAVCKKSDFIRKHAIYRLDKTSRYDQNNDSPFAPPLRGIGLAGAFSGSGYFGTTIYSGIQYLEVTYTTEDTLIIHAMPPSSSIKRIWTRIASDSLNITPEAVILDSSFDEGYEPQLPETIFSNISIMTQLLKKCCDTIKTKKQREALPLTIKKTITPAQKRLWDSRHFCGTPFHSTSFGAAVLELELDPCTYREKLRAITVAVDGGKILNNKAAEASVKLGIQKSLAEFVENESLTCPAVTVQFIPSEDEPKQIGDLIASILPAAYTSALSQALAATIATLPLKTDTIYRKIMAARQTNAVPDTKHAEADS
jgi:xanthine dehydrogenase large subunit